MMWMSRKEFDRNSWFYTDSDVRGKLGWEDFCDMKLPIPSIEKQKEIVKEYNVIVNRIKLNEKLNEKLEETAQAVFKEWFVDFNFPMIKEQAQKLGKPELEGKPYKDNGGKLVWNEVLEKEVPEGWEVEKLEDLSLKITKGTTPKFMSEKRTKTMRISYLKGESIRSNHILDMDKISYISQQTYENLLRSQIKENDICYSIAGSLDKFVLIDRDILPCNTNQAISIIRIDSNIINYEYIYGYFVSNLQLDFYNFNIQQAVQANLSLETIRMLPVIIPNKVILNKIVNIMKILIKKRNLLIFEVRKLKIIDLLLLSKMAKGE